MPYFSIVIPLYNKEDFIESTIKSVLNQNFTDFEVIIINDGSTDNSENIVTSFNDDRIRILNQENRGLCASRNIGIRTAKGKFIAFLDADDLWTTDFLNTIYKLINTKNKYHVFATNVKLLHPKKTPNLIAKEFNSRYQTIVYDFFKLCKNNFGFSSLVLNNTVFKQVGYFDESINYGEEDDFYIRCFTKFKIVYYQEPKTYYRTGLKNQLTAPNKKFKRKIPDYEKYLKNSNHKDLKRFIDFVHYKLVVLFKMEKNYTLVKIYKQKINVSNLTSVQKIKYYLPTHLFYLTKRIYTWFSRSISHL